MKRKIVLEDPFMSLDDYDSIMEKPADVHLIYNALSSEFELRVKDAYVLWKHYSSSLCAGWLSVPKDPERILKCVKSVLLYEDVFPLAISSEICDKSKSK